MVKQPVWVMVRAFAAAAALVMLMGAGEPQQEAALDDLSEALDAGRYGEAYRLAAHAVVRFPDDPDVRYLAAYAAEMTARVEEANAHVEHALDAVPDDPDLLGYAARLRYLSGDERGARALVDRALAIAPDQEDAAFVRDELDAFARARARVAGADPGLPPGSPEAFVDETIAIIVDGVAARDLPDRFALALMDSFGPAARSRAVLSATLRQILDEMRESVAASDAEIVGWAVLGSTVVGDRIVVTVGIPKISRWTAQQAKRILRRLADPVGRRLVDPTITAMVEGVAPDQRAALLARMVGARESVVVEVDFELIAAAPRYQISDVRMGELSVREHAAQIAAYGRSEGDGVVKPTNAPEDDDLAVRIGELIGTLLVVGAGVGVVVVVSRLGRDRRRRQ